MENEQYKYNEGWPPSNYPIFLALVLLAATAVTLVMGDEPQAEGLAIYAYYLLVTGVAIRFFELILPDNTLPRLSIEGIRILDWLKRYVPGVAGVFKVPFVSILYKTELKKMLVHIADVSKNVAILTSVFLLISVIYGLFIDMWFVRGYISNLILIILGFLTLHFFTRAGMKL